MPDDGPDPEPETNGDGSADVREVAGDGATPDGTGEGDDEDQEIGLLEARRRAVDGVRELLDHDVEGVVRVESQETGWRALVEVVERSAVPDTQDIIGRYEVELDDSGTITGYGLLERYRRGDMREEL